MIVGEGSSHAGIRLCATDMRQHVFARRPPINPMLPPRFERYIATRYLLHSHGRPEGRRFVRFIIYMAIGGVAIGVCALLLALAIVRGFSEEITSKIMGFGAHVQAVSFLDEPFENSPEMIRQIAALPDVVDVQAVVEEFALFRRSEREIDGVLIRGVEHIPPYFAEHLTAGEATFTAEAGGSPGVVIGSQLARLLGLAVGDRVVAYSMRSARDGAASQGVIRPRARQFNVAGIYETSFAHFDELYVFAGIDTARDLFSYGPAESTRIDVMLTDSQHADSAAARIDAALGYPVSARTVFETFRQYFAWVRLQESIIPLVIGVIVLVGAFNIVGTLLMIMLEKTPEIGILGSMGASRATLRRLFLYLGVLMGGVGVAIGEALALVLALLQKRYNLIPLPEEAYYMQAAPIALNPLDFLLVGVLALCLCAIAAYIPASVSARIEPIRAIRFR